MSSTKISFTCKQSYRSSYLVNQELDLSKDPYMSLYTSLKASVNTLLQKILTNAILMKKLKLNR
jgi:hypothetical protein